MNVYRLSLGVVAAVAVVVAAVFYHNDAAERSYRAEVVSRETNRLQLLEDIPGEVFYGNRDAKTVMVVYSDASCQYCRALLPHARSVVDASEGQVALVYRHIPIGYRRGTVDVEELWGKCVARVKGSEAFMDYLSVLTSTLTSNETFIEIATSSVVFAAAAVGLSESEAATACGDFARERDLVTNEHELGLAVGVSAIPHTFIVTGERVTEVVGDRSQEVLELIIADQQRR